MDNEWSYCLLYVSRNVVSLGNPGLAAGNDVTSRVACEYAASEPKREIMKRGSGVRTKTS